MNPGFTQTLQQWLGSGECRRLASPDAAINGTAERIVAGGVPLWRMSTTLVTMHPEIQSLELVWHRGVGTTSRLLPHAIVESRDFLGSPVEEVLRTRVPVRCRMEAGGELARFPQLESLAARGCTDYLAVPVELADGRHTALTYATDAPGGFLPEHLAAMESIWPALVMRLDLGSLTYSLHSLLRVYLGQNASNRVLRGGFKRGQGESITAAIWFCDLRGFTALSDSLPAAEVVALLDRYFEVVGGAVTAQGGEILKFIGDAMLAVFPVRESGPRGPCGRALLAAEQALAALDELARAPENQGRAPLRAGIALHLGDVMYGNIGARERLDFTIIGRSVNEAARLESLCKDLGVPLLLSGTFARAAGLTGGVSLGLHQLRGVRAPQEVFTLKAFAPVG